MPAVIMAYLTLSPLLVLIFMLHYAIPLIIGSWVGRYFLRRRYRKMVGNGFDLNRAFKGH